MNQNEYLKHYGVIGMKWGIRRGRASKTYAKASKKANKLYAKTERLKRKSDKHMAKGMKYAEKYVTSIGYGMSKDSMQKAMKFHRKSEKYRRKADRWVKKMEKSFSGIKYSDISKEDISVGKKYVYMLDLGR